MVTQILTDLASNKKLERDRGLTHVKDLLFDADDLIYNDLLSWIKSIYFDKDVQWEIKHSALMCMKVMLESKKSNTLDKEFLSFCSNCALEFLNDEEFRVRIAAGEMLGSLCQREGIRIYKQYKDLLLSGVQKNLDRQTIGDEDLPEQKEVKLLIEKLAGSENKTSTAEQIFHDTAGWKNLETWMKCLQNVIIGCGSAFNNEIDQGLLDLVFSTLSHTNRFVRETGYYVCSSLVNCNSIKDDKIPVSSQENTIYKYADRFAEHFNVGLSDNWSQVRLAASVATRVFLLGLNDEKIKEKYVAMLIAPLCLNRYYVAEGVRIYNQETWKLITNGNGRQLVASYIEQVAQFYVAQVEADNHAVREAACACIAELGTKLDTDVVRPYVGMLLDALIICFYDESWPVRDAACVACGNFILCFPDEAKSMMDELNALFHKNLEDPISSVRQGAAIALLKVVKAYDENVTKATIKMIKEAFENITNQSANVEKYGSIDKAPATYGVVKQARDNDTELHTNKQMYSCGSLAPKMHRGKRGAGCMDHGYTRDSEPWELSDGCCYLMTEISTLPNLKKNITDLLPLLAKSAQHRQYSQHIHYLETIWKQIPLIAKNIGAKTFKQFLELFLDSLHYSLLSSNALTQEAASQCVNELSKMIGPQIFKGRIESYDHRYLEVFQRHILN